MLTMESTLPLGLRVEGVSFEFPQLQCGFNVRSSLRSVGGTGEFLFSCLFLLTLDMVEREAVLYKECFPLTRRERDQDLSDKKMRRMERKGRKLQACTNPITAQST